MKVIARFYWDCGRSGDVEGLFTCEHTDLKQAYGKQVYFGEILGKHSDVSGQLQEKDFTILSEDQDFIEKFEAIVGAGTVSGYNPLDYMGSDDEEYDEE